MASNGGFHYKSEKYHVRPFCLLLCCKQQKGESVESLYGHLIDQAEIYSLGSEETTVIRDAFILNMIDHETQKELLKETVEPSKVFEIAIQMQMGTQNQQQISQNLMPATNSVNVVNNYQPRNRNANVQQTRSDFTRYPTVPQNYPYNSICANCGQRWSHNHRQICPANGKKCNNCGIISHLARKCRQPKRSQGQASKAPQTNVNQIDQTPEKSDDEEFVNYITGYQEPYDQVYDSNYDSDSDNYVAAISCESANQLEPLNAKVQFGEVKANVMIDSGSAVSLITKTLVNQIPRTTQSAKWITKREKRDLKTFANDPIKVLRHLKTTVAYNNWIDREANLTVVEDGHKIIIGRDLFTSLGFAVVQQQQPDNGKCVNNFKNFTFNIKKTIAAQFLHLVPRIGLSKTHVAKSKIHQKFAANHQKGRGVLINLKTRVTAELEQLQN